MGASRQGANLWWWLFKRKKVYSWRDFFRLKIYKSRYLWHDSFGVYFNRAVGCRWGHRDARQVGDPGEPERMWCFACHRYIDRALAGD